MKEPKLIGLAAKARSGKDTVGEYLRDEYNYKLYAFAEPIKKAGSEMFGICLANFYEEDLKERLDDYWGISPREIAQKIGTEGGRELFRKDIWVKRGMKEWNNYIRDNDETSSGMIFTDVRFENESKAIREAGGTIVHIVRDDAVKINEHVSENGVEIFPEDIVIYNNDTLEDLYINVSDILGDSNE